MTPETILRLEEVASVLTTASVVIAALGAGIVLLHLFNNVRLTASERRHGSAVTRF